MKRRKTRSRVRRGGTKYSKKRRVRARAPSPGKIGYRL